MGNLWGGPGDGLVGFLWGTPGPAAGRGRLVRSVGCHGEEDRLRPMAGHPGPARSQRCSRPPLQIHHETAVTPGVKTVWNRVHLDPMPYPGDDQAAEVARLGAFGATGADVG